MGLPSNWRSPGYADDYADHDFADFAQEFLRRNPDYRSDHARTVEKGDPARDGPGQNAAIAGKWGLLFRLRSPGRSSHRTRTLAARCGTRGPDPDAGTVTAIRSAAPARSSAAPLPVAAVA